MPLQKNKENHPFGVVVAYMRMKYQYALTFIIFKLVPDSRVLSVVHHLGTFSPKSNLLSIEKIVLELLSALGCIIHCHLIPYLIRQLACKL